MKSWTAFLFAMIPSLKNKEKQFFPKTEYLFASKPPRPTPDLWLKAMDFLLPPKAERGAQTREKREWYAMGTSAQREW